MKLSKKEKILIRNLKKIKLSQSHGADHLKKVCQFALFLAKKYGGRKEIIIPASFLHDLGRTKPKLHGKASIKESIKLAKPLLKKAGYSGKDIDSICQIILDHDQPRQRSKVLESRILKDADFLDSFGARGILRAVYYTAEAGEPFAKVFRRIKEKMRKRYKSLEFEESKKMAEEEFLLTRLALLYLNKKNQQKKLYLGKYIVFEGISGTGKETQAKLLKEYLEKKGKKVEIIFHPTLRLKETLRNWRKDKISSMTEAFLFIGDRRDIVERKLLPALKKGKWVISLRNRISALVYQAKNNFEEALLNFLFSTFEPKPEVIFYFDLDPKIALSRIKKRLEDTGEEKGFFEKIDLLTEKRKRYKKILANFENVVRIDASRSVAKIHKEIIKKLKI